MTRVELQLPRWIGTIAGIWLIATLAFGGALVVQSRMLDRQARDLNRLSQSVEALADRFNKRDDAYTVYDDRLLALECQADLLAAASRSGWADAYRLLRAGFLDHCPQPQLTEEETP